MYIPRVGHVFLNRITINLDLSTIWRISFNINNCIIAAHCKSVRLLWLFVSWYHVSFRIQRLHENGVLHKLVNKHFALTKCRVCAPDHHVTQSALSVVDIWPIYVVLGAGLALSWFVLLFEHICKLYMDVCTDMWRRDEVTTMLINHMTIK